MPVSDLTDSSRKLTVRWSTAIGVLMSALSIHRRLLHRGFYARVSIYRMLLTANHRLLRLQWVHEHRAWQADWHQVVFSDESRFNSWDHDGRFRVRRYAGERCFPKCVIERDLTPELWCRVLFRIMDDPICYELRVISIETGTPMK
ncbi:transposable element Tcb1 transposase [Trichonephila clavipes]|nr:transposable element Tcb1 transposase [Trichonephila clavipes]